MRDFLKLSGVVNAESLYPVVKALSHFQALQRCRCHPSWFVGFRGGAMMRGRPWCRTIFAEDSSVAVSFIVSIVPSPQPY
jgi:hypothetical protein